MSKNISSVFKALSSKNIELKYLYESKKKSEKNKKSKKTFKKKFSNFLIWFYKKKMIIDIL